MHKRKIKRIIVQLKPEHVALIRAALKDVPPKEEQAAKATRLRDEVLRALNGKAVL